MRIVSGNMDDYWDAIRSTDGLQGGFIWDWMDQGLLKEDNGKKYWAYGGDYGEAVHDMNFNINGLCFPDHSPHPGLYQVAHLSLPANRPCVRDHLSHPGLCHTRHFSEESRVFL